jgi:PKHD-type hydroxylase
MYKIRRYNGIYPQFGIWKEGFSEDEISKITFLEKILKFEKGTVYDTGTTIENKKARDCELAFLDIDQHTLWIYERLGDIIPVVNRDLFMLDIGYVAPLQYTIYEGNKNQHYDWQFDRLIQYSDFERKISGVIILSDPSEYEGGDFEIIINGNPEEKQIHRPLKGEIIFFSSNFPHRVTPVTQGTRKSLVFWVEGKRE